MVLGYQGKDPDDQLKRNDEIMACVKHFALYGAGEAGRDYNTVDMSRNRMFNEYMYPMKQPSAPEWVVRWPPSTKWTACPPPPTTG